MAISGMHQGVKGCKPAVCCFIILPVSKEYSAVNFNHCIRRRFSPCRCRSARRRRRRLRACVAHLPVFCCFRCSGCRWYPVRAESEAPGGVFSVVQFSFCFLVLAPHLLGLGGCTRATAAAAAASETSAGSSFQCRAPLLLEAPPPLARACLPLVKPPLLPP